MKPESRTACWVIITLGLDCSAGFRGDLWGLIPGLHKSGLRRSYIAKIV